MSFHPASPRSSRRSDEQVEPPQFRSARPRPGAPNAGGSLEWTYQGGLPTLKVPSGCRVMNCITLPFAHERSINLSR